MQPISQRTANRRVQEENIWLEYPGTGQITADLARPFEYTVLDSEEAVGQAMLRELEDHASSTDCDIVMVLLGGRGAQAMYRLINERAAKGEPRPVSTRRVRAFAARSTGSPGACGRYGSSGAGASSRRASACASNRCR